MNKTINEIKVQTNAENTNMAIESFTLTNEQFHQLRLLEAIRCKDVLNLQECAALVGVKTKCIYSYTSKRLIPHYRQGKLLVFVKKEVEEWMADKNKRVATKEDIVQAAATYNYLKQ